MGEVRKTQIGSYEAKTKLPELLRQVKRGKSFTITDRGRAVADLVPTSDNFRTENKAAAVERLEAFVRSNRIAGVNVRKLTDEGRA